MKNALCIGVVAAFGLFACAQVPPAPVSESFAKQFSKAENVKWDQEEQNEWEAEFTLNGQEMSACFDITGKWLETEAEVDVRELPANVYKVVQLEFKGFEIEEAELIEKPDFKGHELVLEKGKTEVEILVNDKGELTIKKVMVEEEEDEEGDEQHEEKENHKN